MIDKEKSLAYRFPELAREWHSTKNGDLNACDVSCGSNKKVWWKCKICGHSWETPVYYRKNSQGCPMCARTRRKYECE